MNSIHSAKTRVLAIALVFAISGCAIQQLPKVLLSNPETSQRGDPKAELDQVLEVLEPAGPKDQPEITIHDAPAYDPDYIGLLPKDVNEADRLWHQKYDPDYIGLLPKGVDEVDRLWQQECDSDCIVWQSY